MDCLFCKMVSDVIPTQKLYEDDQIFVIKDIRPKASVHLLVIPKCHIESLAMAQKSDTPLLGYLLSMLPTLAAAQGLDGFRTVINTGKSSGQEIFHLHFHLLGGTSISPF